MKITPLEIRQKRFEKKFMGGYEQDAVEAFLVSLSQEWERLLDENKTLKLKVESNERDLSKMREVESSLFKTLKTAEDTGDTMVKQATTQSELILREANVKAQEMLAHAEKTSNDMMENAKKELSIAERDMAILENYRDNMISEVKTLVHDTLEKMNRSSSKFNDLAKERKDAMVYNLGVKKDSKPTVKYDFAPAATGLEETSNDSAETTNTDDSFFDKIDG
jgi:cell division initiation protein